MRGLLAAKKEWVLSEVEVQEVLRRSDSNSDQITVHHITDVIYRDENNYIAEN